MEDNQKYRDNIATVDSKGKRIWIYPKMPKGRFYDLRKYVSYGLLIVLFGLPFVKWNGEPLFLFNILERKFIIFGLYFAPQDFHLFVLAMLIFIVFIALFTVVFGRLFCGWVCPQTIFMEMVFRRIEYWIEGDANAQKRLNKAPWNTDKLIKKVSKQILFFCIAVVVANTFLSYIIGVEEVRQIITEPISQHSSGFIAMIIFSFLFYFVFSVIREQVCTSICPYGRLQGVLLDKNSIAVYYDFKRGEPRGKIKKPKKRKNLSNGSGGVAAVFPDLMVSEKTKSTATQSSINLNHSNSDNEKDKSQSAPQLGDCIDCNLCVKVCPTGIDIRDGIQLECVNCTACMDACDEVMQKIDRPEGLIRYDSLNGIEKGKKKIFNARVIAYSIVLVVLTAIEVFLLVGRSDLEALLLRTPGILYQTTEKGTITNLYNYQIINKTKEPLSINFKVKNNLGEVKLIGELPTATQGDVVEGSLFIEMSLDQLKGRSTNLEIEVYSNDQILDVLKTNFLGPN